MRVVREVKLFYRLVLLITLVGFAALPTKVAAGRPQCDGPCSEALPNGYCCGACERFGGGYTCDGCCPG